MSNDKMREEYERTSARDTRRHPPKGNNYIDPMAQMDWLAFQKGWKQSREDLVIELPRTRADRGERANGDGGRLSALVANQLAIDECRAAIEAAGLKVSS